MPKLDFWQLTNCQKTTTTKKKPFAFFPWLGFDSGFGFGFGFGFDFGFGLDLGLLLALILGLAWIWVWVLGLAWIWVWIWVWVWVWVSFFPFSLVSQNSENSFPFPGIQKSPPQHSRKSLGNNTTYHPPATGTPPYPPSALP